jgi:hypothetical protein
VYIADNFNNRIRKVENGIITTAYGEESKGFDPENLNVLNMPTEIFIVDGFMYVADTGNYLLKKFKLEK